MKGAPVLVGRGAIVKVEACREKRVESAIVWRVRLAGRQSTDLEVSGVGFGVALEAMEAGDVVELIDRGAGVCDVVRQREEVLAGGAVVKIAAASPDSVRITLDTDRVPGPTGEQYFTAEVGREGGKVAALAYIEGAAVTVVRVNGDRLEVRKVDK